MRIALRPIATSARPIDAKWRCQQAGECCTQPRDVVMTTQEAAGILQRTAGTVALSFRKLDGSFVALEAAPCPLFINETCSVYDIRPYNCRRFACMRPDPTLEPWEQDGEGHVRNVEDRLQASRIARRMARQIQDKAQPWARAHGWTDAS